MLIVTDPRTDYNALVESSYVNIPVIGICNSDNNLTYVDCAIPCNNRGGGRVGGSAVGLSPICTTVSNGSCPGRRGAGPELPAWDPQSPSFMWALELGSSLPPPPLQATRGTVLLSPPNGHEKTMSSSLTNI